MKKALCWLLAFLLTGTLALFAASYAAGRAVDPAMREGGSIPSAGVADQEMQLIRDKITELSEIYGFSPETALQYVTPEAVADLNRQTALWWNQLLVNGETIDAPSFGTDDLAAALLNDPGLILDPGEADGELYAMKIASVIHESVLRIVLPLRLPIIGRGMSEVTKRVDLGNIIQFLLGIRWTALALCALLAGLIALLESRKLRAGLKYIGTAAGGAALVIACGYVLAVLSGIRGMIGEASPSLAAQYGAIASGATLRLAAAAVLLAAGCVLCLVLCRRPHEAKTD